MYDRSKLESKVREWTPGKRPNTSAGADASSGKLAVYISDPNYQTKYTQNIVVANPSGAAMGDEKDHLQPYINAYHTVEVASTSFSAGVEGLSWQPSQSIDWGNWRTASGITVNNHVLLRPEQRVVELAAKQNFGSFWDKVTGNPVVEAIDAAATGARMLATATGSKGTNTTMASKFISRYQKLPVLESIDTLSIPSNMSFNFTFGESGLFSAEEEVVKPCIALATTFMPKRYNDPNRGNASVVQGSAPSNEYALEKVVDSLFLQDNGLGDAAVAAVGSLFGAGREEGQGYFNNIAGALTDLQSKMWTALDKAGENLLNEKEDGASGKKEGVYKCMVLRMGRLVFPAVIIKSVRVKFDFSLLDEYGFPTKGTVSFDEMETPVTADASLFAKPS